VVPPKPPPRAARPAPLAPPAVAGLAPPVTPPAADGEEIARGSWVSVCLFVLLFAAGLALAAWTLLQPFLPHG
jgi:hypothetical protein